MLTLKGVVYIAFYIYYYGCMLTVRGNEMSDIEFDDRKQWPFKDMQVGEVICVTGCLVGKAQVYVHSYARQSGKKFSTKTDRASGNLHVKRIL
jgi:hypothetical protein